MAITLALIRAWLGSLFVYSAALKFARYDQAGGLARPYRLLPPRAAAALGLALPWLEGLGGTALLLGRLFPLAPLLGAGLGTAFTYGAYHVLRGGADIPCGCTGSAGDRVTRTTLGRALAIVGGSLLVAGARNSYVRLPTPVLATSGALALAPVVQTLAQRREAARGRRLQAERDARILAECLPLLRRAAPPTDCAEADGGAAPVDGAAALPVA